MSVDVCSEGKKEAVGVKPHSQISRKIDSKELTSKCEPAVQTIVQTSTQVEVPHETTQHVSTVANHSVQSGSKPQVCRDLNSEWQEWTVDCPVNINPNISGKKGLQQMLNKMKLELEQSIQMKIDKMKKELSQELKNKMQNLKSEKSNLDTRLDEISTEQTKAKTQVLTSQV